MTYKPDHPGSLVSLRSRAELASTMDIFCGITSMQSVYGSLCSYAGRTHINISQKTAAKIFSSSPSRPVSEQMSHHVDSGQFDIWASDDSGYCRPA